MAANRDLKVWVSLLLVMARASMASSAPTTSDPVATSLNQGDVQAAYHALLYEEAGAKVAPLFADESKLSASDPTLRSRLNKVALAFDTRLRKEMNSLTFATYRQLAGDPALSEPDRIRLISPMVDGVSKLRQAQKDTLKAFLKAILVSGVSSKMKASLLVQATRIVAIGLDEKTLLAFCRSSDTTIRKSAFHGLICTIAHNRDLGRSTPNQTVFDSLKGDGSRIPDAFQVLVLASIGEDYARDYLLSKCGTDAVKLVAIIRHDPYLKHPGLVAAALSFSKDTPQGVATRSALRSSLKEPAWVADQIGSGANPDSAKADELRKLMLPQSTAAR